MRHPAFGKTGTLPFDVWFLGWTHQVTAGVWIGADNRQRYLGASRSRSHVHGADTALPVWIGFQKQVTQDMPVFEDLKDIPPGVIWVDIDPDWGMLVKEGQGIRVPHLVGTQPQESIPLPGGNAEELLWESSF